MSRAAAMQANKKDQKAAIAEKNAEKERLAALGLTPIIKKQIGDDVVLCMNCGATKNGPKTVCECKGGKVRPGPDDEPLIVLIAAAKERAACTKAEDRSEGAKNQAQTAKEREKRREERDAEKNDLDIQLLGDDGTECRNVIEFPAGKLGMDLENNAICKISDAPSNAADLGVKVGWVIATVNDNPVPAKKAAIVKAVGAAMKAGPVKFGFRTPITDGYQFCKACDKFLEGDKFEEDELSKGAGVQVCYPCSEFVECDFE